MSRRDTVRLYNAGRFQKHINPDEATAMYERGELDPIFEQRPGGPKLVGYQLHNWIPSDANHTSCALTRTDSIINATAGRSVTKGLSHERRARIDESRAGRGQGPLPEVDRVEMVQDRVAMYPHEFDKRAPSIFNCKQRQ